MVSCRVAKWATRDWMNRKHINIWNPHLDKHIQSISFRKYPLKEPGNWYSETGTIWDIWLDFSQDTVTERTTNQTGANIWLHLQKLHQRRNGLTCPMWLWGCTWIKIWSLGTSFPENKWQSRGFIMWSTVLHLKCRTATELYSEMGCTKEYRWPLCTGQHSLLL
jgi:hypothetical protein